MLARDTALGTCIKTLKFQSKERILQSFNFVPATIKRNLSHDAHVSWMPKKIHFMVLHKIDEYLQKKMQL
jgi:hypothetical protein